MGQIIVSGNLKGGTGKTTIAVNLACALGVHGHGVALLDVDPQGTACDWARRGELPLHAEATPPSGLPGRARWLQRAVELRGADGHRAARHAAVLGAGPGAALMVADLLVIPITPSAVDVPPTAEVLRLVREAREARHDGRPAALLVPNRVDPKVSLRRRHPARLRRPARTLGAEHQPASRAWLRVCARHVDRRLCAGLRRGERDVRAGDRGRGAARPGAAGDRPHQDSRREPSCPHLA